MRSKISRFGIGVALSAMAAVSTVPAMSAAASAATSTPKKVVLKVASNGTTVLATKGELVEVKLSGHHLQWSNAQVVQSSPVLTLVSEGVTAGGGSVTVFRVVNYGTASLQATGTPICPSTAGCPTYVVLWQADVDVPVVDPPPPSAH